MTLQRALIGVMVLLLAGCAGFPVQRPTDTPDYSSSQPTAAPTPTMTSVAGGMTTLRVWLPPQFDPNLDNPAGEILRARLDEFTQRRAGIRIEVRIKSIEGSGGMLDTLTTASAAASKALPDLVAIPRPALEAAALKGLVHPFRGLANLMDGPDWFPYASQLGRLQGSTFGVPFAGDTLILVYRREKVSQPPKDTTSLLKLEGPMIFPAGDSQGFFILHLYQAAGGQIRDEQGRPILNAEILERVLVFIQQANRSGLMPVWLNSLQSDEQAWESFLSNQAPMVVTWFSHYLDSTDPGLMAAPLPTLDGNDYWLATGWVWSLASPDAERQSLSTELAEFLSEGDFLARWNSAGGYLPPRASALEGWEEADLRNVVSRISQSAQLYPPEDVLSSLSPALEKAVFEILVNQGEPAEVAREAANSLSRP